MPTKRFGDRVAFLDTTLRTIGRPNELRERLFARTLAVRTLDPLPDPDRVSGGLPAVDSWHQGGSGDYVIAVSDSAVAAPAVTRALVEAGRDRLRWWLGGSGRQGRGGARPARVAHRP